MKTIHLLILALLAVSAPLCAEDTAKSDAEALREEVRALRQALLDQQKQFQEQIDKLTAKVEWEHASRLGVPISEDKKKDDSGQSESDLKKQFEQALKGNAPVVRPAPVVQGSASNLRLIDLSFDILTDASDSTASEAEMKRLEIGDHDPKVRGIRSPNGELYMTGVIDPYFKGDANIVFKIEPSGDTAVEMEEAYFTTLALPTGLQVRGGQFFEQFGRINPTHPHTWDFADQPVINSRMFGTDGLRGPSVELSWLTPLPFYTELIGTVMYDKGGTFRSFLEDPGNSVDDSGTPTGFAGHGLVKRDVKSLEDLAYLLRVKNSFNLSDEWTLVDGVSGVFGPNDTGSSGNTQIYGGDLYLKWKPVDNDYGWPFVAFQTEGMARRYEADEGPNLNGSIILPGQTYCDWGMYAYLLWGFHRRWVAGIRFDYADGNHDDEGDVDFLRDEHYRGSADVTFYPSEFSKIRLQVNADSSAHQEATDITGILQLEILFGAHGAHKF